jgi:hypothetical protein
MKITRREGVLLIVLFTLICGFLYYQFYFTDAMARLEESRQQNEALKIQLDDIRRKALAVNTLRQKLDILENEARQRMDRVIASADQPDLLVMLSEQLSGLAQKETVVFSVDTRQTTGGTLCTVTLRFATDYPSLQTFLARMQEAPYRNRVVVGTLVRRSILESASAYNLEVGMTVEFFTLGESPSGESYPFITPTYPNANPFS